MHTPGPVCRLLAEIHGLAKLGGRRCKGQLPHRQAGIRPLRTFGIAC